MSSTDAGGGEGEARWGWRQQRAGKKEAKGGTEEETGARTRVRDAHKRGSALASVCKKNIGCGEFINYLDR